MFIWLALVAQVCKNYHIEDAAGIGGIVSLCEVEHDLPKQFIMEDIDIIQRHSMRLRSNSRSSCPSKLRKLSSSLTRKSGALGSFTNSVIYFSLLYAVMSHHLKMQSLLLFYRPFWPIKIFISLFLSAFYLCELLM